MKQFESLILSPVLDSMLGLADRNAFYIDGTSYTYRRFGERVSAIREALRGLSIAVRPVALAVHDDLDTYASIIALWMEGLAYVPLHPNQPVDRNRNIIAQVGASHILDSKGSDEYNDVCQLVSTGSVCCVEDCLDHWVEASDDDLAYILFTSGSTGEPKGVQISRGNLASFMDSFWDTGIEITPDDRCMQLFDLTFDVSVQSFLVALTRGACVYTVPYGKVKYLYAAFLIQEQRVTFGAMAPSMLTYLRPYFGEFDARSLKTCILTAEACPLDLAEDWCECATNADIFDFYGPTEATIYCTYYKLNRGGNNLSFNGMVSIGKPLTHVKAIIVREDGSLAEEQEKGELCVAGPQITPGYWNNVERNTSCFFEREGERYYHTGDLCYMDKSGNIMYSGRIDHQAKIQGFRVELGEIEFHARQYYGNACRTAALAFQNEHGIMEIALFVESGQDDPEPLLNYLRGKMPQYMIPTRVLFEPSFPLNKNEKVDRNALTKKL